MEDELNELDLRLLLNHINAAFELYRVAEDDFQETVKEICTNKEFPLYFRWYIFTKYDLGDQDDYLPSNQIIRKYFDDSISWRRGKISVINAFEDEIYGYEDDPEQYIKAVEKHAVLLEEILKEWLNSFLIDW